MRERLESVGATAPRSNARERRIVVIVPGDVNLCRSASDRRGLLEFFDLQGDLIGALPGRARLSGWLYEASLASTEHRRRDVRPKSARLPRRAGAPSRNVLLPVQVLPQGKATDPGTTGGRPRLQGDAAGLRYPDERAGRPHSVHEERCREFRRSRVARQARQEARRRTGRARRRGQSTVRDRLRPRANGAVGDFDDNRNGIPGENDAQHRGACPIADAKTWRRSEDRRTVRWHSGVSLEGGTAIDRGRRPRVEHLRSWLRRDRRRGTSAG